MKKKSALIQRTVEVYILDPVFRDARGKIFDIVEDTVGHVGMVTFVKKGIQRGNHYHKKSTQYTYVLEGQIELITSEIDGSNRQKFMLKPGSFASIPPRVIHTYISRTAARMLDMSTKTRGTKGYEDDTHRVEK